MFHPPTLDTLRVIYETDGPGGDDGLMWVVIDDDWDVRFATEAEALRYAHVEVAAGSSA